MALSRRDFLKRAGQLALISAVGALASGCATPPPENGRFAERIQLEEWNFSDTRIWWQKEALKLYQRTHPNIDIRWVTLPYGEMHEKLLMTVMAGTGSPDIADVEISAFSRFLKQPQPGFLPLNDRLRLLGALDQIFYTASATDPWSWQGKVYGLGNELNVCLWCYNWQILQQYKINLPITTWDQFAEEGKALYSRSGGKVVLMDFNDLGWGDWWVRALEGGGGFFDEKGAPILTRDVNVRALQYAYDAVYTDKWSITTPVGNAYNAALLSRSIASIIGPSWRFSGFVRQALPKTAGWWMVQLMPRWSFGGGGSATWGGTGVCAMRGGRYPEQAADYIVWEHTTPEAVLLDFKKRNVWPTLRAAWSAPELKQPIDFFNNQNVGEFIEKAAPLIPKWYNSPYWAEVTDATTRLAITPAMHNLVPPAEALKNAQDNSLYLISVESANGAV